jgi:uncharacterized protein (TIGR00730 family)
MRMFSDDATNKFKKTNPAQVSLNHRRKRNRNALGKILGSSEGERPLIAVFGSSLARSGDELHRQGRRMGELLGRAGFDVMTGGYTGVMEAVSHGAHGAGAQVIGVTMKRFEDRVNPYVMHEIHTANFYMRFRWLVDRADGYVAMGGGIGTLAEVTFTWQSLSLGLLPARPFVLVGDAWRAIFNNWAEHLLATEECYEALKLAETPEEAADFLRGFFANKPLAARTRNARGGPAVLP